MGFFDKIKAGLTKTREALSNTLGNVFTASEIDDDFEIDFSMFEVDEEKKRAREAERAENNSRKKKKKKR